jgi:hypothetical protein
MRAIERDNEHLKGVLPKIFGKSDFSAQVLGGLTDHFFHLKRRCAWFAVSAVGD